MRYLLLLLCLLATPVLAVEVPVYSTFENDVPHAPPATGGPDQPSELVWNGGIIEVVRNGLTGQSVAIDDLGTESHNMMIYFTDERVYPEDGPFIVRATVTVNAMTTSSLMHTGASGYGAASWLVTWFDGTVRTWPDSQIVARYVPGRPFNVEMHVDVACPCWHVRIDDEMNGFRDDPWVESIPLANDGHSYVEWAGFEVNAFSVDPTFEPPPTKITFDDIYIQAGGGFR